MKINFNKDILNTIHAVRDYRKFLVSYHIHLLGNKEFDKDVEAEKFFYEIQETGGLPKSRRCYDAIIYYPKENLDYADSLLDIELEDVEFNI